VREFRPLSSAAGSSSPIRRLRASRAKRLWCFKLAIGNQLGSGYPRASPRVAQEFFYFASPRPSSACRHPRREPERRDAFSKSLNRTVALRVTVKYGLFPIQGIARFERVACSHHFVAQRSNNRRTKLLRRDQGSTAILTSTATEYPPVPDAPSLTSHSCPESASNCDTQEG